MLKYANSRNGAAVYHEIGVGPSIMHQGKTYHDFMLASRRDQKVRARFQRLACQFTPYNGTILDFGAGTGIDAKVYAGRGLRVLAYEPCEENRTCLAEHCRENLEKGDVVIADLTTRGTAHVIAANFAVLNLIADHKLLFANFDRLLAPKGYVVVNLLNPFFLGDARYGWWRANLGSLLRNGNMIVEGDAGPIYRFTPAVVARSAQPQFCQIALNPAWPGLALSQYMCMVFRKRT